MAGIGVSSALPKVVWFCRLMEKIRRRGGGPRDPPELVPLYILSSKMYFTMLTLPIRYFFAGGQSRQYKRPAPNFLAAGRYLQPYQKQGTSLDAPLRLPRCSQSRLLVGWLLLLLTFCASHPSICYLFSLKSSPSLSFAHLFSCLTPPK